MNKPSDEMLREIGLKASRAGQDSTDVQSWHLLAGRAAFEESCRIAQEHMQVNRRTASAAYDACSFDSGYEAALTVLRSLTAQPDPAVEAVKCLGLKNVASASNGCFYINSDSDAQQIIAVVDAARAGKGEETCNR